MNPTQIEYLPNGKIDQSKLQLLIISLLTVMPLLGMLYSFVSWYMPIVVFQFYFAILFGRLIAWFFKTIIKICKIRNTNVAIATLSFSILIAIYISWVTWAALIVNRGETIEYAYLSVSSTYPTSHDLRDFIIHPNHLLETIKEVYYNGLWTIQSRNAHEDGKAVKGGFLLIFWILEAGIIIYFSFKNVLNQVRLPFSEETNDWIPYQTSERLGYIEPSFNILHLIETNDPILADIMTPQKGSHTSYSKLILFGDSSTKKYLTLTNYQFNYDKSKKGKARKILFKKKIVVNQLEINDSTFQLLNGFLNKNVI